MGTLLPSINVGDWVQIAPFPEARPNGLMPGFNYNVIATPYYGNDRHLVLKGHEDNGGWLAKLFVKVSNPFDTPLFKAAKEYNADVTKVVSDGGSTDYYKLPKGAKDIMDLIEFKNMNFAVGNMFKAIWRDGDKALADGTDPDYDLNKIEWMLKRERQRRAKERLL